MNLIEATLILVTMGAGIAGGFTAPAGWLLPRPGSADGWCARAAVGGTDHVTDDDEGAKFDAEMRRIEQLRAELDAKGSPFKITGDTTKEEIVAQVRDSFLAPYADEIARQIQPCVRMTLEEAPLDELPLGGSRLDGPPDLPAELEWPSWSPPHMAGRRSLGDVFAGVLSRLRGKKAPEKEPVTVKLDFMAQIRVADLAAAGESVLGQEGVLYFFHDIDNAPFGPEERQGSRVCFWPGPVDSLRRAPQTELPPGTPRYALECPPTVPHRMDFRRGWRVPRAAVEDMDIDNTEQCWCFDKLETALSGKELDWDRILDIAGEVQPPGLWHSCELLHRGLNIGDDLPEGVTVEDIDAGEGEWRLLLQLDGHDEIARDWHWGDGCLYFCMKQQDLETKRFDRVVCVMQAM